VIPVVFSFLLQLRTLFGLPLPCGPRDITHIPFEYVVANFTRTRHLGKLVVLAWIFVVLPLVITATWLALKYLDEPVRAWLTRRYGIKRAAT
jgi:peptidoglycan/LPS O-acetylase OafA/YrhL